MANSKVTPISPKRKRGRPAREVQLLIDAEKSRYKAMSLLVTLHEKAIIELDKLLAAKDLPPQVKLGTVKCAIDLCNELYQDLVTESNQDETEETVVETTPEAPSEPESLIDWGEFSNLNGTDNK